MSNSCGCESNSSDDEYLMVKATPRSANSCGSSTSEETSCRKTEDMFDTILSEFLVPDVTEETSITVCNGAIYSVGMWIEFVDNDLRLEITAINNNIITVRNQCPNGDAVLTNPSPGTRISKDSVFVVIDSPQCLSLANKKDIVIDALNDMGYIPGQSIYNAPNDATVVPVGRINSASDSSLIGKIRKVFGFFLKAGRPYFTALGSPIDPDDVGPNYRRLVQKTSNGAIHLAKSFAEHDDVTSTQQFFVAYSKNKERLRGPAFVARPFNNTLDQNSSSDNPTAWPEINGTETYSWDLDSIAKVDNAVPGSGILDHYFVVATLEVAAYKSSSSISEKCYAQFNGSPAGRFSVGNNNGIHYSHMMCFVKVMKSDHQLQLKIVTPSNMNVYYRVLIDGIFF